MAGCDSSNGDKCLIDALAAAKTGDREANYTLYEADVSRDRKQELKFRCGQCATRLAISIPSRHADGPLGNLGILRIHP